MLKLKDNIIGERTVRGQIFSVRRSKKKSVKVETAKDKEKVEVSKSAICM